MEPRVSISSGLNRHITRQQFETEGETRVVTTWVPDNADPSKSDGNRELVSREITKSNGKVCKLTLQEAVDKRTREAGIKPRKGQSTCLEIIFSGSHEVMISMDRETLLTWAEETVRWAQDTWGIENVVSAVLHIDERTPHIHLIVVPIVKGQSSRTKRHQETGKSKRSNNINPEKLRLCMSEVYTNKRLYDYHSSYTEAVGKKYCLARGIMAQPGSRVKHKNSEEYNRDLQKQALEKEALIAELTADYEDTQNEIKKNREIIARHTQTISDNQAIIKKQLEYKSSTVISNDAADRKIQEKLQKVRELEAEETNLNRSIVTKKTELATLDANVKNRRAQLEVKVNLNNIPQKKGFLGRYITEELDNFFESYEPAILLRAMNSVPSDIKVDSAIQQENERLRKVEDDYKDFMDSPERMQKRIEYLEKKSISDRIKDILGYALRKDVKVLEFDIDKTPKGEDIYVTFTIEGNPKKYAGRIDPAENIIYTSRPLNSMQELKEHWNEPIWCVVGNLSEIRKKREREDTLSRYSIKLSNLTKENIKVIDYVTNGREYLLFAQNGLRFFVEFSGKTFSTKDSRVSSISSVSNLNDVTWKKYGDIKNPKIGRGISR